MGTFGQHVRKMLENFLLLLSVIQKKQKQKIEKTVMKLR